MKSATKIISEFGRKGHPLGKSIYREEVPELASQLRQRLDVSESDLNFSPTSLKLLEDKLSQTMGYMTLDEEEIVKLVREISAYIGEVLALHANGRWEPLGTLWSTRIVFEGNIKITKGGQSRIVPSVAFSLGNIGAAAWDMICQGKKPLLYKDYMSAKKKSIKEEVSGKNI